MHGFYVPTKTWNDQQLAIVVTKATSVTGVVELLGLKYNPATHRYIKKAIERLGVNTDHFLKLHKALIPKIVSVCQGCNLLIKSRSARKFCTNKCQAQYRFDRFVALWKKGKIPLKNLYHPNGSISSFLKTYLWQRAQNKCERCGWNKPNPITGRPFLECDHIDGDCTRNNEANLILLCLNCHSLTPTFKGLNKGFGRKSRLGIDNGLRKNG